MDAQMATKPQAAEELTPEERQYLLRLARAAAAEALGGDPVKLPPPTSPRLLRPQGCFVTFTRRGQPPGRALRGCLGTMEATDPLWESVRRVAGDSVTHDPRFWSHPVTLAELPQLHIDISALHPRRLLKDPLSLELGADGIVVEGQGLWAGYHGVYLPQVATEHHMTKEQFLSSCCGHKAGIPADAWKTPSLCRVYAFRAEVFGEE
jgi:AmmeMemoRadiSam system protein A